MEYLWVSVAARYVTQGAGLAIGAPSDSGRQAWRSSADTSEGTGTLRRGRGPAGYGHRSIKISDYNTRPPDGGALPLMVAPTLATTTER